MPDPTKDPKDGVIPPEDKTKETSAVPPKKDEAAPEAVSKEEFEKVKSALAKANKEAEKSRLALKEQQEKVNKLFSNGKDDENLTPEVAAQRLKDAEKKNERILLKSAFIARVAKDAVDPEAAFEIASKKLGSIKVDLNAESVDGEALDAAVAEFRESHKYFFTASGGEPNKGNPPNKTAPDGNGQPNTANPYGEWQKLLKSNRGVEAQQFFAKNKTAIYANWPKG